ncbi:MAG: PspC domain-containing protein [Acidobacteriota bacterium]
MEQRILKKSHDKMLFGVCGGLAHYFGWDPVMVRFMFILVAFFGGSSLVVYFILLFVMPRADTPSHRSTSGPPAPTSSPT